VTDLVLTPTGLRAGRVRLPCSIGRAGISTAKREGDGATPAGDHRIVGLFFRPDRIARARLPAWAEPIRLCDLWCDAPDHPDYNHLCRAPFTASAETLRRADPIYDLILVTDWNWPVATPHGGSAIFIHQWRRPGYPTAGCIALARRDLFWLVQNVAPGTRLTIRP